MYASLLGIRKERFDIRQGLAKRILGKGEIIPGNIQDHWEMESGKDFLAIQYVGFQLG